MTGPPESDRLRDFDSPEHSPKSDRDFMESETASGVIKDDNNVKDKLADGSSGQDTNTTNNLLGSENRLPAYAPARDQRSSIDLEAQDQPGREPRGGSGGD
ncbi:hypothetical protein FVEN_g8329 [Fusarium venenatum]|nr:hypothetical protein FVEN_g8329 [Fusarium venenatum]KAH7003938.1 hypothetical protein EDB82DRAFT_37124 [Fusarium venenatum]